VAASTERPLAIMLVAGEASGDLHGATLARALRIAAPAVRLYGMGGRRMAAEGVELMVDVTAAATVGGTEAVGGIPGLYRAYRRVREGVRGPHAPDALVVIDFPEFNLRLARAAREAGVVVAYFIPPQIWAWRPWRVRQIRRVVSMVLAVFPFEAALYRRAGVPVQFVGHPVLDALADAPSPAQARSELGLDGAAPVIGLLPGSRRQEVAGVLPAMREASARIAAAHPNARFVVAQAPTVDAADLAGDGGPPLRIVGGRTYAVMRAADLLLVTSGTATLEAAMLGTPMVVCYRLSRLSELLFKPLVRVPWISLANITLGRAVVPELYQRALTGEALGREALRLLDSPAALAAQREAFHELTEVLGSGGVGARAAQQVLHLASRNAQTHASRTAHPRSEPASRTPLQ
jgi:lipid-A-disaccharide synthase